MSEITLEYEGFNYAYHAREEAHKAAVQANRAQRFRQIWNEETALLYKWRTLLVNAPISLHNALFVLFAVADMILSWEMVRAVVVQSAIPENMEFWAVLVFCLLLNAWAAVTAHFIGRGWSREVQDWERWNFIFVKHNNDVPPNIVAAEMRREVLRARFWAVFSGLILVGLVGVIIYFRIVLLPGLVEPAVVDEAGEFSEAEAPVSMSGLSLVMAYLPLAIILGELFTGDYFWYTIRRWQKRLRGQRHYRRFMKAKESCGWHDRLAVQYADRAQEKGERLDVAGDLEISHLRLKFRTQQQNDYTDPMDNLKIAFTVRYRNSGKPVGHARIAGILPNGAKTGDYQTDEHGRVVIHPDRNFDQLVAVQIDKHEFLGPFQYNGEHYIELPGPLNGQH